ncbi:MAG: DNA polymerase III subunit delta' [Marvinbryantia sp.]|uniref:DNA polymerase III subunit delta' n=1 Tax=Marvinbryantia sp. TaxID=2496532 RepID=UPI0025D709D6|nr:DNA polymerase III subunit delta' [uncultured Marvinbryantia sp.]
MKGFRQIIGHKDVIGHLQNAIATNKVSHAYILNGEKGSGKKTIARVFAKALNCESDEEKPCDTCHSCRQANSGNHPDIMEVTHEKPNSISVDDIREQIVEDVQVRPYSSPYKVYIVSDAEKMTMQAQNALLKTIEEPPSYVVVLLLTTNAASLLPTILSRCVMLNTKPVPDSQVRTYLMEHVKVPDYQADICVAFAQGNIGKAVQLATSENFNEIKGAAIHLLTHLKDMDIGEITAAVKAVSEFKVDVRDYLDILAVWYRDVLYFKATNDANGIIFRENLRAIQEQTRCISYEGIERILEGIQKARTRLTANVNFELTMELLFLLIKENGE